MVNDLIKQCIKVLGTKTAFAKALGITFSGLYRCEQLNSISLVHAPKIASILGKPIAEIEKIITDRMLEKKEEGLKAHLEKAKARLEYWNSKKE